MGTVLIHAGMPKTGSTSVQEWLRRNATRLRDDHGITILTDAAPGTGSDTDLVPVTGDSAVVPMRFLLRYFATVRDDPGSNVAAELTQRFVDSLHAAAVQHSTVLLTAEGFSTPVAVPGGPFIGALERLTADHDVRLMYYVRPQDDALESRWRQWGYKNELGPADWIRSQISQLEYAARLDDARSLAPSVSFVLRPFRRDLLEGGDVVTDLASGFLGVAGVDKGEPLDENPGIPLDLAILLRDAPPSLMQTPEHRRRGGFESGLRQLTLAKVTAGWDLPESSQAREAREALRSIAHATFEAGNQELIRTYGWATDEFVVAGDAPADLDRFDRLWRPQADPATLAYFYAALADLCSAEEERNSR